MIGLGGLREALHFVRAADDGVCHVVANTLALARQVIDRVNDSGAGLLVALGRPVPDRPGGVCHSLARLRSGARDEPEREAGPDKRARQESNEEPAAATILSIWCHVLLLSTTLQGSSSRTMFTTEHARAQTPFSMPGASGGSPRQRASTSLLVELTRGRPDAPLSLPVPKDGE